MILVGNQRGGAKDLARHLMKDENERVVVHEVRGFASDDLYSAFQESHAVSRGTRCKQHLYSLSLNPPKEEHVTPEQFVDAISRAEERLGLTNQPRAIVFHEKQGMDGEVRRHAHAVWCRIDIENMRAVQLSYDHSKLNALGRELYLEHGWKMPQGFVRSKETNPRNYTLAEWQQAKRAKKDPAKLKGMFQDCWAISDSQASFAHALKERGYILARGNRDGIVAVDHQGEVYAVRTYVGIKPKQVREKVKDSDSLPDAIAARNEAAKLVSDRLKELKAGQERIAKGKLVRLKEERRRKHKAQTDFFRRMSKKQQERWLSEERLRQEKLRTGLRGLIDRVTGKRKRTIAENRVETEQALRRDQAERSAISTTQKAVRKEVLSKARATKALHKAALSELNKDINGLESTNPEATDQGKQDREAYIKNQRREANRPRRRRGREGPSPER